MNRRNILWSAVSAVGAALGASRAQAATEASTGSKLKVVYHLSDAEKVQFRARQHPEPHRRRRRS
ncbi:hypothetical protein ACVWWR_000948 [Bradyrhizobium sp. LM3.2]